MNGRLLSAALLCAALTMPAATSHAGTYFRVVSWNARHMGWNNNSNWTGYAQQIWRQFGSNSTSPNGMDVVFIQEIMYADSAANLANAMKSVSGVNWDYRITHAIGRTSYKERYAVLWRTDRVSHISSWVWNDVGDKFEREPQIVRLRCRSTSADFTFINWHTIWGNTTQREAEIREIRNVFNSVQNSISTDKDIILVGDHNRNATSPWWSNLTSLSPTVSYRVNVNTTINSSCNFANPYDHFWFQAAYVKEFSNAGRDYIANMCTFYQLSDHAPIWMRLYSTGDDD